MCLHLQHGDQDEKLAEEVDAAAVGLVSVTVEGQQVDVDNEKQNAGNDGSDDRERVHAYNHSEYVII